MKANAKKLLALIMAMVMSLSLAAPAMAAGGSVLKTQAEQTATATDVATSSWEIKYDDEKGSFEIKTAATATDIVAAGNLLDTSKNPSTIKVTQTNADDYLIGGPAGVPTYKVVYTEGATTATFEGLKVGTAGTIKSLKNLADSDWTKLTGDNATIDLGSNKYGQVQGSYYEERMSNGSVNVYFKLNQTTPAGDPTDFTNTEVYFVAKGVAPGNVKAALKAAKECDDLGVLDSGNATVETKPAYVKTNSETYRPTTYQFTVTNVVDLLNLNATLTGLNDVKVDTTKDSEKTTGTFQVTIKNTTSAKTENHYFLSSAAEAKEVITKQLADCKEVAVENVSDPQGNTFTVTLKLVKGVKDVDTKLALWTKNTMTYGTKTAVLINDAKDGFYNGESKEGKDGETIGAGTVATGPVVVRWAEVSSAAKTGYKKDANGNKISGKTAVDILKNMAVDPAAPGFVFGTGMAIVYDANEKALTSTINANNIDTIVFYSAAETKNVFFVDDCKQGTTIPYTELKLSGLVGGQVNPFVTVTDNSGKTLTTVSALAAAGEKAVSLGSGTTAEETNKAYTVTANLGYSVVKTAFISTNESFVKKGSIAVSAANHGNLVEVVEITKEATCKTPGEKVTKKVCDTCNSVVGTPKVEAIPVLSDPVEKNTNLDPTDSTKKKMIFDADDVKVGSATAPKTKHYLTKAEVTTTTSDDKMTTTTTVDYYCNFGEKHSEESKSESITKTKLQHSGRYNSITLKKATDIQKLGAGYNLFSLLRSVEIADSDIENENIIMNRTAAQTPDGNADATITLGLGTNVGGTSTWTYGTSSNSVDWSTVDNVYSATFGWDEAIYATATGVPSTKHYVATVTVKDVKEPKYAWAGGGGYCDDGSCVVSVVVYEVKSDAEGLGTPKNYSNAVSSSFLSKNLAKNKVVVVNDKFNETVTLTGSGHKYFNDDGIATDLCVWCGTKKQKSEAPDENDLATATVTIDPVKYAGTAMTEKDLNITVKLGNTTLARGIDFEVGELNIKAAGKYTVVVAGKNTYNGRQAVELTVTAQSTTAKKQSLKVNTKKKTFKVKNLKKKKASFKVKLSGAKTAVTWKSNNAKVTVKGSKTKATITVKKGTKKGTYKVTATAKKTSAYKKGTVTIKVIVK